MARDKSRDDKLFNCDQTYELGYVSGLYTQKNKVHDFLLEKCREKVIYHSTHKEIYQLIKEKLGLEVPD
jgi:hypothetical protein